MSADHPTRTSVRLESGASPPESPGPLLQPFTALRRVTGSQTAPAIEWRVLLGRVTSNAAATVLVRALSGVTRLVVIVVARVLGPETFGRLALALVFVELSRLVADAGLSVTAIRRFSRSEEPDAVLLGRLLALNACLALPFLVAPQAVFALVYGRSEPLLFVLWAVVPCGLISGSVASLCQARLKMKALLPASAVGAVTTVALVAIALATKQGIWAVSSGIAIGAIAEAAAGLAVARREVPSRWLLRLAGGRRLLAESLPVLIGGSCVALYSRLDTLMVARMLGEIAVGQYAAAYRLTEPFLLVLTSLSLSVYASLSRVSGLEGWAAADRRLRSHLPPLAIALGVLCLVLSFGGRPIVAGVYGSAYLASVLPFRVLAWAVFLKGLSALFTAAINARGRFSVVASVAGANLAANAALNLVLIPRFGIGGAAAAVVLTESLGFVLQLAYLRRVAAAARTSPEGYARAQ